ncbi:pyridoxal phosphate-dependent aminotransferase [Dactylosporangium sp. NPDC050688]|uniref:pyridoxal phosphate-dependent aminotransferase n=1 Tax=Dactylosporangium sp. NPDC050688 TaxID=3157217 RepID=UPI0033DB5F9F
MTPPRVSHRAGRIAAHRYADFPVGAGDMDLRGDGSPQLRVTAAVMQRTRPSPALTLGYGDVAGDWSLRNAVAELFGVDPGDVIVTTGASEALHLALACTTDPGTSILLPTPAFPGFAQLARLLGLHPTWYPVPGVLPHRNAGEPMLICSPHNPTGVVSPHAAPGDGWTIWDVSHTAFAPDDLAAIQRRLTATGVVVFSLSKLLRLPGIRVGCLITRNRAFADAAVTVKTHLSMSASRLSQHLAAEILADPATVPELAQRAQRIAADRDRIIDAVTSAQNLQLVAGAGTAGTHLLLQTLAGSDAAGQLRAAHIVGLPGTVFGGAADTARICFAQPVDVIDRAVKRLASL